MSKIRGVIVSALSVVGIGVILGTAPAQAHHAFSAEFDAKKPVHFVGMVTKVEWINPHSWFHIEVKQPDGSVQKWMIEAGNPANLFRRGFTKDIIKPGMEIQIVGYA